MPVSLTGCGLKQYCKAWNTLTVRVFCVHLAATLPLLAVALFWGSLVAIVAAWLLGMAGMAAAAAVLVSRPLETLHESVSRWRPDTVFQRRPDCQHASSTRELRQLAVSFQRATVMLHRQKGRLATAIDQQELLMQEVHHRVKNNLQVVASLLNLQASRIRMPEARAEFQSARDRVRTLATLHRHLYAHGELHTINMREFLIELCSQLFQAMGEKAGERLRLEIEAPELKMSSDQAVPLALIVTEAVSNAVKYAFPGGRRGSIAVYLKADRDHAELEVFDDGVGIPAGRVETESGTRDGIGIQLIRGFARQLGATLEVEEGHGTRYRVRLPLQRKRLDSPMLGALASKTPA